MCKVLRSFDERHFNTTNDYESMSYIFGWLPAPWALVQWLQSKLILVLHEISGKLTKTWSFVFKQKLREPPPSPCGILCLGRASKPRNGEYDNRCPRCGILIDLIN